MRVLTCSPVRSMLMGAAVLFALPAFASTVTLTSNPDPLLEPYEKIIFDPTSSSFNMGTPFAIDAQVEQSNNKTENSTFTLTIDDVTNNVSASFTGTFTPDWYGDGTITFSGKQTKINGTEYVTATEGIYTFGITPTINLSQGGFQGFDTFGFSQLCHGGSYGIITQAQVPEPATWTFAAFGFFLIGLGFARRGFAALRNPRS